MKSIVVPVDMRSKSTWQHNGKRGSFSPSRKDSPHIAYKNHSYLTPNSWVSREPMLSARFFVGFNVGEEPKYQMSDLVGIVKRVRRDQLGKADSSFIYQRGIYTHESGETVTEEGAQAILLNLDGKAREAFTSEMIVLAETIRDELEQEIVIFDLQLGGVVQETFGIDAQPLIFDEDDNT